MSTDFEGIIWKGKELYALHANIVVKVAMIKEGIKAVKNLLQLRGAKECFFSEINKYKPAKNNKKEIFLIIQ
ncbi:transaldolase family protein [Mucilaginibacter sp. 5C4]|nr:MULTISPECIES: transaldolase family protein [unclassified Mucilaginibacter]MEB0261565.1 transaldolase family protein [Mucilaginibacter sp. 10I4]MEB0277183.1 transaldolase family protein [Mucilaginibacter sp. 10B2]MEB0300831.1 transaldolase family protein [Mucilaginibacter sp. 5C4]WPX25713.1 transaldolase family protein [Mucilaginibacter sp. 5C4]